MIKPVKCVLVEIESRKVIVGRLIKKVLWWTYVIVLHLIVVVHIAWVYQDTKERDVRQRLIEESVYVVEGKYNDGSAYFEEGNAELWLKKKSQKKIRDR